MKYEEFIEKWKLASTEHIRVDNCHPLDFYLSKGSYGESRLVLIAGNRKVNVKDSEIIKIDIGKRSDGRYSYSFMLLDENFSEQFYRLCFDLIDSSRQCSKNEESYKYVINLFFKWQKMMKVSSNTKLNLEEIKGLIGELIIFYREVKLGADLEKVISSWQGPDGYYQDFVFEDTWYEVKSITKRSEKILISSIEQLDVEENGVLFTVSLDKVNSITDRTITLNSIIEKIKKLMRNDIVLLEKFNDKLNQIGYWYTRDYDDYIFEIGKVKQYNVDDNFPRIKRGNIPIEIGKVKYEIIISCISDWLMGEVEWS